MMWFWLWIARAPDAGGSLGLAGVGEHPFPALACGFGKVLTAFHVAQRWNEQTQLAPRRMSSCKPARHFQSWKHFETSQQPPADPPGNKLAPMIFALATYNLNWFHVAPLTLLLLRRTFRVPCKDTFNADPVLLGQRNHVRNQQFAQPGEFCWMRNDSTELLPSSVGTTEGPETRRKPVSPAGPSCLLGQTAECL